MLLAACGPSNNDAQVRVSVSDSSTGTDGRDTVINNTTIIQQAPPDTVVNNRTIIERQTDTVVRTVPGQTTQSGPAISNQERAQIDRWLTANDATLNQYGDPEGTMYAGGNPLFDERSGTTIDLHTYIYMKHADRPWASMR